MSLDISLEKNMDPFALRYEPCSKCGGRLTLMVETVPGGGQKTSQACRKCGNKILTTQTNVIRVPAVQGKHFG